MESRTELDRATKKADKDEEKEEERLSSDENFIKMTRRERENKAS